MNVKLNAIAAIENNKNITVSGSKSESNRLLILQNLFANISIANLSDSDDAQHMQHALKTEKTTVDIGHAGTAMRFLTSYFAVKEGREVVLTGSERMQNRPIKILVDALKTLGADITYEGKDGYPPIRIKGKNITAQKVTINGNVSSQYISSLLLIAAKLDKGLDIELVGNVTSVPYINMTISLLRQLGINATFTNKVIKVLPQQTLDKQTVVVESDWSSASYFYSIIAASNIGASVSLSAYKKDSLQGDSSLETIYKHFGVTTTYQNTTITLTKTADSKPSSLDIDLKNAPDIAQTIAVTCFLEGIATNLTGLHTLKIKETDRLEALKAELTKLGAAITVTDKSLHLEKAAQIHKNIAIETYNDHRMAMSFAPIALKVPVTILDANVVTKSYQKFWEDLQILGFKIEEL